MGGTGKAINGSASRGLAPNGKRGGRAVTDSQALPMSDLNIAELAEDDVLDPIIGRESEINRVCQILARRKKNNPMLIGEPGVGKCVVGKTLITIKRKSDNIELTISIDELLSYKY